MKEFYIEFFKVVTEVILLIFNKANNYFKRK